MSYSGPLDVLARWPRIHTANLSHDELRVLIADGDAYINARLATRYAMPIAFNPDTTPPIIKRLSATFALLDVFDRSQNTPEWIRNRFERESAILDMLATGEMVIVTDDGGLIPQESTIDVPNSTTKDYVPVFGGVPSLTERYDPERANDEVTDRGLPVDPT